MFDQANSAHVSTLQPLDAQFAGIVERAQARDQDAFVSLIRYYEGGIHGYLRKWIGDDDIADDLLSETILRVWKALPNTDEQLRSKSRLKSWLYKIATNLLHDYFQKCSRLRTVSLEYLFGDIYAESNQNTAKDRATIENLCTEGAEDILCERERITSEQERIKEA